MKFHRSPHIFVSQVRLKVLNLERALSFYQNVIGFRILERTEKTASLTADGKTALVHLRQPDDAVPKRGRTTGLYHFALLLPTRSDLAQMTLHLAEHGVPVGSSDHRVSEALYLSDPDGNGIEIYRDRDPAEWEWRNGEVTMTVDPLNFADLLAGQPRKAWTGLPADTVMGHIHLHVSELPQSERFYVQGLGFEVVNRFGSQALFLSTGKYHHHIGLNTWNGVGAPPPPENSVGLESFSLVYPDESSRERAIARLRQLGASVREDRGAWQTADPSGNRIRLLV